MSLNIEKELNTKKWKRKTFCVDRYWSAFSLVRFDCSILVELNELVELPWYILRLMENLVETILTSNVFGANNHSVCIHKKWYKWLIVATCLSCCITYDESIFERALNAITLMLSFLNFLGDWLFFSSTYANHPTLWFQLLLRNSILNFEFNINEASKRNRNVYTQNKSAYEHYNTTILNEELFWILNHLFKNSYTVSTVKIPLELLGITSEVKSSIYTRSSTSQKVKN